MQTIEKKSKGARKKTPLSTSGKLLLRVSLATFVLFIIVLGLVYLVLNNQFYKTLLTATENQIRAKNDEISFYLESKQNWIQAQAKALEFYSAQGLDVADTQSLQNWLATNSPATTEDGDFQDLTFLRTDAKLVSATGSIIDFSDPNKYGKNLHIGGSYYDYLITKQKGDALISDHIFLDYIKDKYVAFMVFHTVKSPSGKVIGALGAAFKTTTLNKIIRDIDIGFYTQPLLVDSKALSIAHILESHVGTWNLAEEGRGIIGLQEAARDHMQNPRFEIKELVSTPFVGYNPTNTNVTIRVVLLPISATNNSWELGVSVPNLSFKMPMFKTMLVVALVFLFGFVGVYLLFYLSMKAFNRQINKVATRLSQISQGDGDLRIRLERQKGDDALPKLVDNFNDFTATVAAIVEDIMATSNQLNSYADAILYASAKMEDDMQEQQKEIDTINSSMQQMVASVTQVANYAQQGVNKAKNSTEDSKEGSLSLESVIASIAYQADAIMATAADVEKLQDAGSSIGEVMEVINAIAEQTNLLALNAAIEAARAGEAGRGFAVVADEVRALAARTHQSTETISQTVDNLRLSIETSATAMRVSIEQSKESLNQAQKAGSAIEDLSKSIESIEEMNLLIASATEEQTATVDELSTNLAKVVEAAATTNAWAQELKSQGRELIKTSKNLKSFIDRFKI